LNAVFRAFHTVKGGAGFLALEPMVQLCHHAEDLLNLARNGVVRLDASYMDALLQTLDRLLEMMAALGAGTPLAVPPPELLQALLPRGGKPAAAPAPVPAPSPEPAGGAIDDSEFEALLDSLYGTAAPGTVAPTTLPPAPAPSATIDDDEFEALLDTLHGQGGQPGLQDAGGQPGVAAMSVTVPASTPASAQATPAPAARHAAPAAETTVRVDTARLDLLVNHAGELVLARN